MIRTGRSTVYTKGGIVCSVSPLAASAGIGVLREGGNAFDAAIATAAVEGVTVSPGCGLGAEPFVLMYHAKTGKVNGLTGSGRAPKAMTRDYLVGLGHREMPLFGPLSAAIPGEVHAWQSINERYGTMPLSKLLEPAIGYAENGFPLPPRLGVTFTNLIDKLNSYSDTSEAYTNGGKPYGEGDVLVQRRLANTLRRVAKGGADEFYRGDTARELIRGWQAAGGLYTLEELAAHETEWYDEPIKTTYRGYTVYETRPPSQGLILLEMLNILEAYDIGGMRHNSPEVIHLMVEAKKLAYADRNAYMGDPAFVESPLDELISKEFAAERRRAIDPNEAAKYVKPGPLAAPIPGGDDTSYFCVVDSEGNALSFIHSLSHGFGSGFVAGNTGVCLNNRIGRGFTLTEGHPNVVAPGKRTMHTLNAYIAVGDSGDVLIGGTPGGDNQIQWNAQVLANYIDYGMTPQQSVEAARWDNPPGSDPHMLKDPFTLNLEDDMPEADVKALRSLGHDVIVKRGGLTGGAVQLIVVDTNTGVKKAGSDPRTDGQAVVV